MNSDISKFGFVLNIYIIRPDLKFFFLQNCHCMNLAMTLTQMDVCVEYYIIKHDLKFCFLQNGQCMNFAMTLRHDGRCLIHWNTWRWSRIWLSETVRLSKWMISYWYIPISKYNHISLDLIHGEPLMWTWWLLDSFVCIDILYLVTFWLVCLYRYIVFDVYYMPHHMSCVRRTYWANPMGMVWSFLSCSHRQCVNNKLQLPIWNLWFDSTKIRTWTSQTHRANALPQGNQCWYLFNRTFKGQNKK